jgi:regulator of ribonuclease activity B
MSANMPISEMEIDAIIQGHEARNAALRQTLIEKGVDLGEPRTIECHFWSWSPAEAASLAEHLTKRGFEILAQRSASSSKDPQLWNVEAAVKQSAALTLRREFTDELVRIGAAHLGKYDGWGTRL